MSTRDSLLTTLTDLIVEGSLSGQGSDGGHQDTVTDIIVRRTGRLLSRHRKAGMESRWIKRFLQRVRHYCHAGGNASVCVHPGPTLTGGTRQRYLLRPCSSRCMKSSSTTSRTFCITSPPL